MKTWSVPCMDILFYWYRWYYRILLFLFYYCSLFIFAIFCCFYARYFRYVWWRMRFHYSIDNNWHLEFMVPGQMDRILQIYNIVHVHFGLSVNVNIFGAFISILLASLMSKIICSLFSLINENHSRCVKRAERIQFFFFSVL